MKEDILEQIAEDIYSKKVGHFTKHNIKFRPSDKERTYIAKYDSVHSDIDLIIIDTHKRNKIIAVSCKSWQGGFNILKFKNTLEDALKNQPIKTTGKKDDWCAFKELCIHSWTNSFLKILRDELNVVGTKEIELEYVILCTKITKGSLKHKSDFENSEAIKKYFKQKKVNLKLKITTIDEKIAEILKIMNGKDTPYVENTHLSRTLQLMIASGLRFEKNTSNSE
jgi:hypothetical protein